MEKLKVFSNLIEQLRVIRAAATTGIIDPRLIQLNQEYQASHGMQTGIGSDGGFAIQTDFAGMLLDSAAKAGDILPLVDQYPISANANGVHWVEADENDVSSMVYGGIHLYWDSEASIIQSSEPKLRERKMELHRLTGLVYATHELSEDATLISDWYEKAFTLGIQRKLEEAIICGDGIGKPIGILGSPGQMEIAKETSQTAATIKWENVSKMYNQALNKDSRGRYVWLAHPDATEQFDYFSIPSGEANALTYFPNTEQAPTQYLKGRPVIESEFCSALGTSGDLMFVDLSQYILILKNGVRADQSIHVNFSTAENAFRFIFRANGMPKRNKPVKIKNSAKQRSSYITLADRS